MKHDKLSEAMEQLSDRHIAEAAASKRKRLPWVGAVAAVLVLCVVAGILLRPGIPGVSTLYDPTRGNTLQTVPGTTGESQPSAHPISPVELLSNRYAVATPEYPQLCSYPLMSYEQDAYSKWWDDQRVLHNQPEGYADNLNTLWYRLVPQLLQSENGGNTACSPVNIYMALAMLAECTGGDSQKQLLTLLNADSIETLRAQAREVWRGHYNDDGLTKSILGSSLWLEENYGFDPDTVQLLAENYYASVFQGDLGSEEMNNALRSWLNEQTEGLLGEYVEDVKMDASTVLALVTTVNYQVQWVNEFSPQKNVQGVFHGVNGNTTETFMRTTLTYGPYCWSDHFGATALELEDGSRMWLILPDEGYSPQEIAGEAMTFLAERTMDSPNQKSIIVNLSVPKFDVASDMELSGTLKRLGVTDVFQAGVADFSSVLPVNDGGAVDQVKHAARVMIDEKGVTAAAFTAIMRAGAAMPPTDEIDFTLDRPFLFVVESQDGLPLFAGIVNEP